MLGFQFLGIPPKGEQLSNCLLHLEEPTCFQFLGIPPKGEHNFFPAPLLKDTKYVSNF